MDSLVIGQSNQKLTYDCQVDQSEIMASHCDALIDLYNSTAGDTWFNNTNWGNNMPSSWHGVTTGGSNVTEIVLDDNNLDGPLPASLADINTLSVSSIGDWGPDGESNLTGSIPSEIGSLSNLQYLWLQQNALTGNVPTTIGNLTSLRSLYLHQNQLSGSIPTEVGTLSSADAIYLGGNQFTGTIPDSLGTLGNLSTLVLGINQLGGQVPSSFGGLNAITILSLSDNNLSGVVPSNLDDDLSDPLTTLTLSNNGCLTDGGDTALGSWLAGFDANWNNGCTADEDGDGITNDSDYSWNGLTGWTSNGTTDADGDGCSDGTGGVLREDACLADAANTCFVATYDCTTQSESPEVECEALRALHVSTNGGSGVAIATGSSVPLRVIGLGYRSLEVTCPIWLSPTTSSPVQSRSS